MILSALLLSVTVFSQGIKFQEKGYADVLKMAKKENKLVFIDVYTSWCGPCKQMAQTIFPEAKAGEFYNAHFLNLQVDAEKSEDGKRIAKTFMVSAYPTFLFVNGDGELVYRFLGGRMLDQFVEEGQKAVDAFEALPELKKYAKEYDKGNRDMEFLNRYFILKNKAGLDCSDVLFAYFAQVDDAGLLDTVNIPRIDKISVFDSKLTNRFVDAVIKESKNPDKDKKQFMEANRNVCKLLGACLKDVSQGEDEALFDEVMALKDRLFTVEGNRNSASSASLGGGNIYIPSGLLRLNYYAAKKKENKFVNTFENYITEVQNEYLATYKDKETMQNAMKEKLAEAKKSGNEEEYKAVKRVNAMMTAFSSIDDYYVSTNLINDLEQYCEFYKGDKNAAFDTRVADWYVFLHRLSPSVKTAVYAADKLLEMNKKENATDVLTLAMERGTDAVGVVPEDIEACKVKLEELSGKAASSDVN